MLKHQLLHGNVTGRIMAAQTLAKEAINNNIAYKQLNEYCLVKNISPGGSADLLSVALLLHFVKNEKL